MSKKKKTKAKKVAKVSRPKTTRHDVVVRVEAQPMLPMIPTTTDLAEPIRNGKQLSIPKTWLSEKQITRMVEETPKKYVYQRPGKGGGKWDYVTVSYVQRVLDYCFGFNWDFEIIEHGKEADHVWVLGRLTVYSPDGARKIVKSQFGRSEVKHTKSGGLLDYGNDLKAASSDALKKCASMLGIARDIYGKTDYKAESGNDPRPPQAPEGDGRPPEPDLSALDPKDSKPKESLYCHGASKGGCPDGAEVSPAGAKFSKQVYGKILCRACAAKSKPLKK